MFIISNYATDKIKIDTDYVTRVNLAWVKPGEAREVLGGISGDVYLDYPSGRTKPPKPKMTIDEAIDLANEFNVRYFAVSNVESVDEIKKIKSRITSEFVPKIETVKGVKNINEIALEVDMIMLDKEDLYVNCGGNKYEELIEEVRKADVSILELIGVIFQKL